MKTLLLSIAIIASTSSVQAQSLNCQTVLECAQAAAETAATMQQVVGDLQKRVGDLESKVAALETQITEESGARALGDRELNGQFKQYVKYGAPISLRSSEGFLYSYNHRGRDELDVLISSNNDSLAKWTVGK